MALNLINSDEIKVSQNDEDIKLELSSDVRDNLYYKSGDTFTYYIKSVVTAGSNNLFRYQVPLSRPVADGVTATVMAVSNYQIYQGTTKFTIAPSQITNTGTIIQPMSNCLEVTVTMASNPSGWNVNAVGMQDSQITVTFSDSSTV